MQRPRIDPVIAALLLIVLTGLGVGIWRGGEPPPVAADDGSDLGGVLGEEGGSLEGYARVTGPRDLRFPRDHLAHPDYRSEWWYFTGNLQGPGGHDFGFQLTFFRFALAPSMPSRPSDWATRQAWMAHLAVTDVDGGRHYAFERFQRGALGLAGAEGGPVRIWLDDWTAEGRPDGLFPLQLRAHEEGIGIDLRLTSGKPRVLQGDRGYSRKSEDPANASHYYSYTRLQAQGRILVDGEPVAVQGSSWLDREWSTSALDADQTGWDWFSLQLDDGRDLMVYRLRRRDGGTDPWSAGALVGPEGRTRRLDASDFTLEPLRWWRSPSSGARYPVAWRVAVPGAGLDLEVRSRVDAQEMDLMFRYWEGAVSVRGRSRGRPVTGQGYLELTGYRP